MDLPTNSRQKPESAASLVQPAATSGDGSSKEKEGDMEGSSGPFSNIDLSGMGQPGAGGGEVQDDLVEKGAEGKEGMEMRRPETEVREAPEGSEFGDVMDLKKGATEEDKRIALEQGTSAARLAKGRPDRKPVPRALVLRPRAEGKVAVLSIDGGGVRAAIPANILVRLEKILQEKSGEPQASLCDFFDMFAGTSAGGCLVMMLTMPGKDGRPAWSAADVRDFWTSCAHCIFKHRAPRWMEYIKNVCRPLYKAQSFERLLERVLGKVAKCAGRGPLTLKDSLRPVLVTGYDILKAQPYFFESADAMRDPKHDFYITDVCRATSAAPTIFRPKRLKSVDNSQTLVCVDGGVVANNPTMMALLQVVTDKELFPPLPNKGQRTAKDLYILSLGAGEHTERRTYEKAKKWGLVQWAYPLMDMMVWGNGRTVDAQISMLCTIENSQQNYIRIEVNRLPKCAMRMDNASQKNLVVLGQLADDVLQQKAQTVDPMRSVISELDETNWDRLLWLADRLVEERRVRLEALGYS